MLTSKISPSMMCADFFHLDNQLDTMQSQGIEYLHIDIMDGVFVPNYTLGVDFCRKMHEQSSIPLDIHLMIVNPEAKLRWFPIREGDYVSVHYEAGYHISRALQAIRGMGGKPMLALNPGTPADALTWLMDDVDAVLVMTVNPGFAGQKYIPSTIKKIREIRNMLDKAGKTEVEIEVDGNVTNTTARMMREAGSNIFVAGSSSVFKANGELENNIAMLRQACK